MIRMLALCLAVLALAGPAAAQASRAHLPPVNGVAFGARLAAAQAKLGPTYKVKGEKIKELNGPGVLNGKPADVQYVFRSGGRLSEIYVKWYGSRDAMAESRAQYAATVEDLTAQFGKPDEVSENFQATMPHATTTYVFRDRTKIRAGLFGHAVSVSYGPDDEYD